jgi:hypothetical protein
LTHKLLPAARLVTLALMAASALIFGLGLPLFWRELVAGCGPHAQCTALRLTPAEVEALHAMGLSLPVYATIQVAYEVITMLAMTLVGVVVVWRRGHTSLGLLAGLALVSFGAIMSEGNAALVRAYPATLYVVHLVHSLGILTFAWLLLLFPNGRFAPRWAWLLALPLVLLRLVLLLQLSPGDNLAYEPSTWLVYSGTMAAIVGFQVYRYRAVSNALQRQQTKWVVLGFAGLMLGILMWMTFYEIFPLPEGRPRLIFNLLAVGLMLALLASLPVSLGFSILRYRLWDIDLIIRRAMLYSALTLCLGAGYFVSVIVFQALLDAVAGAGQSQIVIVLSTLLQAALFDPLRRKLQDLIDRRFYRSRYDMARVLSGFGSRLRSEVDIDSLRDNLVAVVDDTLQPEWSSLWLVAPRAPAAHAPARALAPSPRAVRGALAGGAPPRRAPQARRRLRPIRRSGFLAPPAQLS